MRWRRIASQGHVFSRSEVLPLIVRAWPLCWWLALTTPEAIVIWRVAPPFLSGDRKPHRLKCWSRCLIVFILAWPNFAWQPIRWGANHAEIKPTRQYNNDFSRCLLSCYSVAAVVFEFINRMLCVSYDRAEIDGDTAHELFGYLWVILLGWRRKQHKEVANVV